MALPGSKAPLPGYRLIVDSNGNYIDDVPNLRLGPEFVLSRNTADPSANISVAAAIASSVAAGPPNSGTTPGRFMSPIEIDYQTVAAQASVTSLSFPAGKFRKLFLDFDGTVSAFSWFQFQANALATSVYTDLGYTVNTNVSVDAPSTKGTLGFARVGVNIAAGNNCLLKVEFNPLTTGRTRLGFGESMSDNNSATAGSSMGSKKQFAFNDIATDVTFVTLSVSAATMTGTFILSGIPA